MKLLKIAHRLKHGDESRNSQTPHTPMKHTIPLLPVLLLVPLAAPAEAPGEDVAAPASMTIPLIKP